MRESRSGAAAAGGHGLIAAGETGLGVIRDEKDPVPGRGESTEILLCLWYGTNKRLGIAGYGPVRG